MGGVTVPDDKEELRTYDLKVWRAAEKMEGAMMKELESLGVPFFGLEEGLLLNDTKGVPKPKTKAAAGDRTRRISRSELKTLQMRMIQHLEDLYKD